MDGPFKCRKTRINPYILASEPVFVNLLRSPGNDSQPGGPIQIGMSYRPSRLKRLAESIPGLPKRLQIRAQERTVYHTAVSTSLSLSGL
jgi:hypothetical protein